MDDYSIFDAAKILNKDHTAIREWFKKDYIPLEKWQKAKGRGTKTVLLREDIYRLKLFSTLIDLSFKSEVAAGFINSLHGNSKPSNFDWDTFYANCEMWEDGGFSFVPSKGSPHAGAIDALVHVSIDLKIIKQTVDLAIEKNL